FEISNNPTTSKYLLSKRPKHIHLYVRVAHVARYVQRNGDAIVCLQNCDSRANQRIGRRFKLRRCFARKLDPRGITEHERGLYSEPAFRGCGIAQPVELLDAQIGCLDKVVVEVEVRFKPAYLRALI